MVTPPVILLPNPPPVYSLMKTTFSASVFSHRAIQEDDLRGYAPQLAFLAIERALGRCSQQTQHQRRERSDHGHRHLDDVPGLGAQMVLRQNLLQEHPK